MMHINKRERPTIYYYKITDKFEISEIQNFNVLQNHSTGSPSSEVILETMPTHLY